MREVLKNPNFELKTLVGIVEYANKHTTKDGGINYTYKLCSRDQLRDRSNHPVKAMKEELATSKTK